MKLRTVVSTVRAKRVLIQPLMRLQPLALELQQLSQRKWLTIRPTKESVPLVGVYYNLRG
ncbi:MAG: hypothetical protein GX318_03000 [Clostridia bacterium]|nr:hypothetical protein [Clostridia bacterium]